MDHVLRCIPGLDQLPGLAIFLGMGLGILNHVVDLLIGETAGGLDHDRLFLAGRLVPGGDIQYAVGVYVEIDLDLRHAAGRGRYVAEVKAAQRLVARDHFPLALEHMHGDRGLIIVGRGEGLAGLGRDRGVLLNEPGHHAAERLDAE